MKRLNKKGFTLVELLAVVVILAVLMLVAVTAVGPAINNSKKSAFFSTASSVVDAAQLYMASEGVTSTKCVKVSTLVSKGYLTSKDSQLVGVVLINVGTGDAVTYSFVLANGDYYAGKTTAGNTTINGTNYTNVGTVETLVNLKDAGNGKWTASMKGYNGTQYNAIKNTTGVKVGTNTYLACS